MKTAAEIQTIIENYVKILLNKQCRMPAVVIMFQSNMEIYGAVQYYPDKDDLQSFPFWSSSIDILLGKLEEKIHSIPPKEERNREEYLKKIAAAIEFGKAIGIEEEFLNPLKMQMKKLSSNIIEDKREEKDNPYPIPPLLDENGIPF